MKRIRNVILFAMLMVLVMTNASAVQLQTNGTSWFLPDGRIVQTKRVMTENSSAYPGLLCYRQSGELLWEHTFRTPAIGRSFCELTDDQKLAFMYHDQNHQYFIEYFDQDGTYPKIRGNFKRLAEPCMMAARFSMKISRIGC